MQSLNKVMLIGHLGNAPEVKQAGASKVAEISLACSERYKQGEEWKERTEWARVVAWGKLAELSERFQKGDLLYVEGKLQTRSWDDKQTGKKAYRTEIYAGTILDLTPKKAEGSSRTSTFPSDYAPRQDAKTAYKPRPAAREEEPDDLPF